MTVYVDNARIPATVQHIKGRWSHLVSDAPEEELHAFAASIGLRRSWYQGQCRYGKCDPCPHGHYDVTDSKRDEALAAGAQAIDIRDLGAIIRARRVALRAAKEATR